MSTFSFFKYFFSFFILIFLFPNIAPAHPEETGDTIGRKNHVEAYLDRMLKTELGNAAVGVLALSPSGDTIAAVNQDRLLIPASNMKLVTTGVALHRLGSGFTFRTRLGYSGSIIDRVLKGDLYIMGGGDPTLASDDSIAVELPALFREWTTILKKAGIERIDGHIIGDDRYFDLPMPEDQTWQWDDCGTYYGAGTNALTFFENIQSFDVAPGPETGYPATVSEKYPVCPWMSYSFDCTTGEPGSGDKLYYYTSDLAPVGAMRGTFAVDRAPKTLECSNKFPALTCAAYFADWIETAGISCSDGPADTGLFIPEDGIANPEDIRILGETASPALLRIAFETNHESNNVYAETLYHMLGRELYGSAGYEASAMAVRRLLSGLGLDSRSVSVRDGSGLSRHNLLSPSFICSFLQAMTESPEFDNFAHTLPSPGSTGTMQSVMPEYDRSLTERIKLKSGSMSGVKCFSGYIFPENGGQPTVFSIMINNTLLSQYRLQKITDRLIYLIALAS